MVTGVRYCQLDVGHALGALRYAQARSDGPQRSSTTSGRALVALMGLDRTEDFPVSNVRMRTFGAIIHARNACSREENIANSWEPRTGQWSDMRTGSTAPFLSLPVIDGERGDAGTAPASDSAPWSIRRRPGIRSRSRGIILGRRSATLRQQVHDDGEHSIACWTVCWRGRSSLGRLALCAALHRCSSSIGGGARTGFYALPRRPRRHGRCVRHCVRIRMADRGRPRAYSFFKLLPPIAGVPGP